MRMLPRYCITFAVVACVAVTAAAQPVQKEPKRAGPRSEGDCDFVGTWQGANCLDVRVKRLDAKLNATYKQALAGQEARGLAEEMRKAQRIWLQHTHTHCDFVGTWEGVSGAGAAYYKLSCIAREYGARIEFLKRVAVSDPADR